MFKEAKKKKIEVIVYENINYEMSPQKPGSSK